MKILIILISLTLFTSWLLLSYFLLGHMDASWLQVKLPESTAELGDSLGILNGLFSALAVVLALVAVLLQGRELRASTKAQNEQAEALKAQLIHQEKINEEQLRRSQTMIEQLRQQQIATQVITLQAQQNYHATEIARMEAVLEKLEGNHEKAELFNNSLNKKKQHITEQSNIIKKIKELSMV